MPASDSQKEKSFIALKADVSTRQEELVLWGFDIQTNQITTTSTKG
jgi:hypothetical protein